MRKLLLSLILCLYIGIVFADSPYSSYSTNPWFWPVTSASVSSDNTARMNEIINNHNGDRLAYQGHIVSQTAFGFSGWQDTGDGDNYSFPQFTAAVDSPTRNVYLHSEGATVRPAGILVDGGAWTEDYVPIAMPAGAQGATGQDAHCIVNSYDGNYVYDLYWFKYDESPQYDRWSASVIIRRPRSGTGLDGSTEWACMACNGNLHQAMLQYEEVEHNRINHALGFAFVGEKVGTHDHVSPCTNTGAYVAEPTEFSVTGTLTVDSGDKTLVTGSGTTFTTDKGTWNSGYVYTDTWLKLTVGGATEIREVDTVESTTHLHVKSAYTNSGVASSPKRIDEYFRKTEEGAGWVPGMRIRLKSTVNCTTLYPSNTYHRSICEALKTYGAIMVDTGSSASMRIEDLQHDSKNWTTLPVYPDMMYSTVYFTDFEHIDEPPNPSAKGGMIGIIAQAGTPRGWWEKFIK